MSESYNYKFRLIANLCDYMTTHQFISEDTAMARYRRLTTDGWKCEIHPIKHNKDPRRADYEYRLFDLVQLPGEVGMVLCLSADAEPEFHGFRPDIEQALAYVDEYWYQKGKENE